MVVQLQTSSPRRLAKTLWLGLGICCALAPSLGMGQETAGQAGEKRAENLPENINARFLDPDMNVEDFIKRFEIESREVFACREQILAAIDIQAGMHVADVGAGTGLYMGPIARSVGREGKVFAVEVSPKFVKHLRQRAKDEDLPQVEVVLCSERKVNLKPGSVDRVFICDVYHHFEYPKSTMRSIHAALRTGGKLIVVDFDRIEGKSREWLLGHIRAPKAVFKQEIIDAGFQFEKEIPIDGFEENYLLRFTK